MDFFSTHWLQVPPFVLVKAPQQYHSSFRKRISCDLVQINLRKTTNPANIYLFKVNKRSTRKIAWNMFKVNNKKPRRRQTLTNFTPFPSVSIVDFEQVNVSWKTSFSVIWKFFYPSRLTYFMSLVSFYTPWKHQKTQHFLTFSEIFMKDSNIWIKRQSFKVSCEISILKISKSQKTISNQVSFLP